MSLEGRPRSWVQERLNPGLQGQFEFSVCKGCGIGKAWTLALFEQASLLSLLEPGIIDQPCAETGMKPRSVGVGLDSGIIVSDLVPGAIEIGQEPKALEGWPVG